jgi:hypothetical protein
VAEILELNHLITRHDLNAPDMLRTIAESEPADAFVITWPKDKTMPTYHSSTGNTPVIMLRIQEFIHKYYSGDFDVN